MLQAISYLKDGVNKAIYDYITEKNIKPTPAILEKTIKTLNFGDVIK